MFNPRMFENSRPDGHPVLEILTEPAPGQHPRPDTSPDQPPRFVPLRRTELAGEIVGPVAALRLTQEYRVSGRELGRPVEAVYRFPLPGDAAVTGVRVRFGEVAIQATLAERAAAEQEYQAARDDGRQAALLTRESPDVFALQISGIRPDEAVVVETSYAQLAHAEGTGWSLRVPLTTAPRFTRSDERGSPYAQGQPLGLVRDPGHRFALDLSIEGADAVASPTHALDTSAIGDARRVDGRLRLRLRDGDVLPDRDFVLTWQPRQAVGRPTLEVLRHIEPATGESPGAICFLALAVPPAAAGASETLAREIILLIDHSGSMEGPKWEAADWTVQNLLAGLTPRDTFNLGLFHDSTRWFAKSPVRADARTLAQARDFLLRSRDSGGTNLGVGLEQALGQPRDREGRARSVLIVTDAQVSDAGRIVALVEQEAARTDRRRVSVLCIDAAPNSGLALEVAERGGGLARFLTSDPAENDIATALDEVLADWAAPLLANLRLEIDRPGVQAAGRRVTALTPGTSAIDLGDLAAGRAVWVAGRIGHGATGGAGGAAPTIRLVADGREIGVDRGATEQLGTAGAPAEHRPAVAALFGARRVLDLELISSSGVATDQRLRQLGYTPDVVLAADTAHAIYPENARAGATDVVRTLLVREALRYGIACSATAFVATRSEAGERVAGTVPVMSALPHGWSDGFLMARTATGGGMAYGVQAAMSMTFAAPAPMMAPPPPGAYPGAPAGSPPVGPPAAGNPGLFRKAEESEWTRFSRALGGIASRATGSWLPRIAEGGDEAEDLAAPAGADPRVGTHGVVVFAGVPRFVGAEALLFDSAADPSRLPPGATLQRLILRLVDGGTHGPLDPELVILLYVDDLTAPRARVRLADILRQGGERPLNVRRQGDQVVRVVLADPRGAWSGGAPRLEVALA